MCLNAISFILRAVLAQNVMMKSDIILVNLQLFSIISDRFPEPVVVALMYRYKAYGRDEARLRNLL